MEDRKRLILLTIIKEHIKTGAPVGSGVLVEKYRLDVSPATVRNDMAALEQENYIIQPHTSAGRVPTEKAYRLYINDLGEGKLKKSETAALGDALKVKDEAGFKNAARMMSQASNNMVYWAFHRHNLYYTGISNLFQQPEFSQLNIIYDLSSVVDRFGEIVDSLFADIGDGSHILLGSENPFGDNCATVLYRYRLGDNLGMVGILGPLRMDYEKNKALIAYVADSLADN